MSWQETRAAPVRTHHLRGDAAIYDERFDEVFAFHAPGLAAVRRGREAWHITIDGSPAYDRRFEQTFGFYEGLAAVVSPEGWLHIATDGADLYEARYDWCGNYQGGRCTIRERDGSYLHITPTGVSSYDARWRYAGDYRDGVAVVQGEDGCSTHIDRQGGFVHGIWFLDLDVFHKGFARARDDHGWMHVDGTGRPIYVRRFMAVEPFYNRQARVERFDGGLEVIDESGATTLVLRDTVSRRSWFGVQRMALLDGRYRLDPEAPIARSSHGAVWSAQDLKDARDVVVKSSSCGEGHRRELHALQVLQGHPCAPVLRDRFSTGESHYLVMDIAHGKTVGGRSRCDRRGVVAALRIIEQAADVAGKLHQAGLVHTDLHSGNLLVDTEAEQPRVTVLDYEFTVPIGEGGRWRGEVHWGRWEFVPPEQFEGFRELDPTADTYALAGLFCFYASGHAPFHVDFTTHRPEGWAAVRRAFLATRRSPDLTGLPESIHLPLTRALSTNPAERYTRAYDLVGALSAAISQGGT